jgi:hypothetical protein
VKNSPPHCGFVAIPLALLAFAHSALIAETGDDHLVPVSQTEIDANYRKLWEPRLIVTPGEVARFILLTDGSGAEGAASVYHESAKIGALPGDYWIAITETSAYLGQFLPPLDDKKSVALKKVEIKRCDAPIPASVAQGIHQLWLQMLAHAAPDPNEGAIQLDSSTGIFSARNSQGKTLEAETPKHLGKNTDALIKIAFLLHDYCIASASERSKLAEQIDNATRALLKRFSRN